MLKHCKKGEIERKVAPNGKRITFTLPCNSSEFQCSSKTDEIQQMEAEIKDEIQRTARGKGKCNIEESDEIKEEKKGEIRKKSKSILDYI